MRKIFCSCLIITILIGSKISCFGQVREIEQLPDVSTIGMFDTTVVYNAYRVNEYYISTFDVKPEQFLEMIGMKVSVAGKLKVKKVLKANSTSEYEEIKLIKGPFFIIIKDKKPDEE